ncbi:hypothetical protein WME75_03190 [Sorangium sp. So ce1014]|uniref:hypothetical protein n=1 Tax=Sorangium sp. So ce1014 TaxID=3133326 RepID=UPI003F60BC25
MRVRLLEEVRRFRCTAVLAAALHATACQQVPDCRHCHDGEGDPRPVPVDGCGVFARAGEDAGGAGKSDDPYTRLQDAIDHAEGRKVCACADKAFAEAVTLRAGIEVHGGYTCNGEWEKSADRKSTIVGPAGQVALTLTGEAGGVKVQGFEIRASAIEPGGSSIAVAVAGIAAELRQMKVVAGDGMPGQDGEAGGGMAAAGRDAPAEGAEDAVGAPTDACVATPKGGEPGQMTCGIASTNGGAGGPGGTLGSIPGASGNNGIPETMAKGRGGTVDTDGTRQPGENGVGGPAGTPGEVGSDEGLTLGGITGGDGAPGGPGTPGQGGGGGAGSYMIAYCEQGRVYVNGAGASGGGGGAGGCGGKGGAGGKAGGSSIGIVSLGTQLVLVDVAVTVGKGGRGGSGAGGQEGGPGGKGAAGGKNVLGDQTGPLSGAGGNGGLGGAGGPGAGGRGGHAIGIAYKAAAVDAPSLKEFVAGQPGGGGQGGRGPSTYAGHPGNGAMCWNFQTKAECRR